MTSRATTLIAPDSGWGSAAQPMSADDDPTVPLLTIQPITATDVAHSATRILKLVASRVSKPFIDYGVKGAGDSPPEIDASSELAADVAAFGPHSVYACLVAMERYTALASPHRHGDAALSLHRDDLMWSRARFCELLAVAVLEKIIQEKGLAYAIQHVLTASFPNHNAIEQVDDSATRSRVVSVTSTEDRHSESDDGLGLETELRRRFRDLTEDTRPESAIEQGLECVADTFVVHKAVTIATEAIWDGSISYSEPLFSENGHVIPRYTTELSRSDIGLVALFSGRSRLTVPLNRNLFNKAMFIVFLVLYGFVINKRTENIKALEWVLIVFGYGFAIKELGEISKIGFGVYLTDFWNVIDLLLWSSFLIASGIRFWSVAHHEKPPSEGYYDLLSLAAVPLWMRALSGFSDIEYVNITLLTFRRALRDSRFFIILLLPICIGFAQALRGLDPHHKALEGAGFLGVLTYLLKGFIGDLDFDVAAEFDPFWGPLYYGLFVALSYIILLNILVALYWESYYYAVEHGEYQYRSRRIIAALDYSDRNDKYPWPVPFNMAGLVLVGPIKVAAKLVGGSGKAAIASWESGAWWLVCLPAHLLVAVWEEVRYFGIKWASRTSETVMVKKWMEDTLDGEEEAGAAAEGASAGSEELKAFIDGLVTFKTLDSSQAEKLLKLHRLEFDAVKGGKSQ